MSLINVDTIESRVGGPPTLSKGVLLSAAATFIGDLTRFDGAVSIGGTLTYEDVTNIDAIGIITARSDIRGGRNLNVTGLSTFSDDVVFTGASANVTWDKSVDDLIFGDNAKAAFGAGSDFQIAHTGSHTELDSYT